MKKKLYTKVLLGCLQCPNADLDEAVCTVTNLKITKPLDFLSECPLQSLPVGE